MDAFDVLGLEPTFDLDATMLDQRYRDLQRALHPDKFAQAPAAERRASLSRAMSVSDAYRALRDELTRAELVFARYGGDSSETAPTTEDPALLFEIMELREQLAGTRANAEVGERERLARAVEAKRREVRGELRLAFSRLAAGDRSALAPASAALTRLRYYRRFLDEVAALEEAFD